jgi:glycosyltransferase involved in cell wall biosynthesis
MKILVVCSGNSGFISPFVQEQVDALISLGIKITIYQVKGRGILGYLNNLPDIKKKIKEFTPDLIHAHYGLSGLLSCMQRDVRVIITFHGSDGYIWYVRLLSKFAARLSAYNIFVSSKIRIKIGGHKNNSVIPCGIKMDIFFPLDKNIARNDLGLDSEKKYILFSGRFDNKVKNFPLAEEAVKLVDNEIELIELKNKTRAQVNLLLNACDLLLLTSYSEGSPQIIKEAMACNSPIVATDVGDILDIIQNVEGTFLSSFLPIDISNQIIIALKFGKKTNGREKIKNYDNNIIAKKILAIYQDSRKTI